MNQMFCELARSVVVAQFPPIAPEHEKGASAVAARDGIRQAHDLKRNFLHRSTTGLLPLKGNEDLLVVFLDDGVNFVDASAAPLAHLLLSQGGVAPTV